MAISGSSFIHGTTLFLRALIASGVTDPVSRTGNQSFVMTSFPEREVQFPVITLQQQAMTARRAAIASEDMERTAAFQVDVWSKSTKQRDNLTDAVIQSLKTTQVGSINPAGLYNFSLLSCNNMDEEGKEGIHRKTMTFGVKYIA